MIRLSNIIKNQKKLLQERSIWEDPNGKEYEAENPAIDGDGWSQNFFRESGFFDSLELATDIAYEVENNRPRGSKGEYGDSIHEMISAMKIISDEFLLVQRKMTSMLEDWEIK